MKITNKKYILFVLIPLFLLICVNAFAQVKDSSNIKPQPQLIKLNLDSTEYQSIFKGPPQTVTFHSGLVTLKQGEKVGHHNTEDYEEILVIFSGEGQMIMEGGASMNLKYGVIAYCPPFTEHDVKCTSSLPLKYLYIASKTK